MYATQVCERERERERETGGEGLERGRTSERETTHDGVHAPPALLDHLIVEDELPPPVCALGLLPLDDPPRARHAALLAERKHEELCALDAPRQAVVLPVVQPPRPFGPEALAAPLRPATARRAALGAVGAPAAPVRRRRVQPRRLVRDVARRVELERDELAKGRDDRHGERVDGQLAHEDGHPRLVEGAHARVVALEVGLGDAPRALVAVAAQDRPRHLEHLDRRGEPARRGGRAGFGSQRVCDQHVQEGRHTHRMSKGWSWSAEKRRVVVRACDPSMLHRRPLCTLPCTSFDKSQ